MQATVLALSCCLAACGGGSGGSASTDSSSAPRQSMTLSAGMLPTSDADAFRFLTQTTFGPTAGDVARVKAIGYDNWIDEQFAMHLQSTHLQAAQAIADTRHESFPGPMDVNYSWWTHALKDPAQLRQRVAFALSEIFVVSTLSVDRGTFAASYLDMLTDKADANYRDLLESVALHPAMGLYLSHLANRKEDPTTGRVPDENFAREIMQLFSIGLYELDDSGNPVLVNGKPVETYTADDIKGLAKVFTGFSWYKPATMSSQPWWACFWRNNTCSDPSQESTGMIGYAEEHSTSIKQFLGVTVPVQATPDPLGSLKAALDRLASHHNTAPFISRQLIQRLVTSNPSNSYVSDITQVFRATNGNLRAVVKAILLHDEARHPAAEAMSTYGKLREPVLRLTHLLRAIPNTSSSYEAGLANGTVPFYRMSDTTDPSTGLGQAPMRAPSVFNFFRPGYRPPQGQISNAGLVAPEMQITSETSVLFYANAIAQFLDVGVGDWATSTSGYDIHFDVSKWNSLVDTPSDLVNAIARNMLGQPLPDDVTAEAVAAIAAMPATSSRERRQRIQAAILMTAVSPSFIVQQ